MTVYLHDKVTYINLLGGCGEGAAGVVCPLLREEKAQTPKSGVRCF